MLNRIFDIGKIIVVLCCSLSIPIPAHSAFNLPFRSELNRGNDLYKKGAYEQSEKVYKNILEKKANDLKAKFNLGNSFYKEEKYQESQKVFESLTDSSVPKDLRESAYYNLGNSLFKQEDYQSAIGAYEEALKINPEDEDARFNLELAKKMMTMPKQQKNQQEEKKEKNKMQRPEGKSENKDKDKNNKEKERNEQQQIKPGQMSKEDALRILNALNGQQKHKNQTMKAQRGSVNVKDW